MQSEDHQIAPLSPDEFAAAEQLFADLLATADNVHEEQMILLLHRRLTRIYEKGAAARQSRDHLMMLQNRRIKNLTATPPCNLE